MQRGRMLRPVKGGNDMKRAAAFLAALLLALSLAGCGGEAPEGGMTMTVSGTADRMPRVAISL